MIACDCDCSARLLIAPRQQSGVTRVCADVSRHPHADSTKEDASADVKKARAQGTLAHSTIDLICQIHSKGAMSATLVARLVALAASAAATAEAAAITVDAASVIATVSPLIYGCHR